MENYVKLTLRKKHPNRSYLGYVKDDEDKNGNKTGARAVKLSAYLESDIINFSEWRDVDIKYRYEINSSAYVIPGISEDVMCAMNPDSSKPDITGHHIGLGEVLDDFYGQHNAFSNKFAIFPGGIYKLYLSVNDIEFVTEIKYEDVVIGAPGSKFNNFVVDFFTQTKSLILEDDEDPEEEDPNEEEIPEEETPDEEDPGSETPDEEEPTEEEEKVGWFKKTIKFIKDVWNWGKKNKSLVMYFVIAILFFLLGAKFC